jgi:hypothetical protein
MWFGIGFVTLVASVGWRWYSERTRWKGKAETCNGLPYQYKYRSEKYSDKLWIGVDFNLQINCAFRKETWFDQGFKALRLTKEHQTGLLEFDEKVYFISDSPFVQNLVSTNTDIAENVLKIMTSDVHGARFTALYGRNGCLWAEYKLKGELRAEKGTPGIASFCVPALQVISNAFQQTKLQTSKAWRDPYYWIAAFFSVLASGLMINGCLQLFRWLGTANTHLLPNSNLLQHTLGITVTCIGLAICVAAIMLSRTSRAHMTLIELLLAGGFGMFITTYYGLKDINAELDVQHGMVISSEVASQRIYKRRSTSKPLHYLTIKATDKTPQIEIEVSPSSYSMARNGSQIKLKLYPGKLGYPWITDVQVSAP